MHRKRPGRKTREKDYNLKQEILNHNSLHRTICKQVVKHSGRSSIKNIQWNHLNIDWHILGEPEEVANKIAEQTLIKSKRVGKA